MEEETVEDNAYTKRYNYYKNMPRSEFMRKTLTLFIQLVMISAIICPLSLIQPIRLAVTSDIRLLFSADVMFACASLVLIYGSYLMLMHPFGSIFIFIMTVIIGLWCGIICANFRTVSVIVSIFFVIFLCTSLTAVAIRIPYDFTKPMRSLSTATFFAVVGYIVYLFWPSPMLKRVIVIVTSLLISVYFVVDWQMIIGGQEHLLHVKDFTQSSTLLFIDIVVLLICSLMIIGELL